MLVQKSSSSIDISDKWDSDGDLEVEVKEAPDHALLYLSLEEAVLIRNHLSSMIEKWTGGRR